jgi:23S rRNA pseudouridine1911/1915/1917 synthase
MKLEVLHCDNHVLALVKPACVPSVPDASGDESLLDAARDWIRQTHHKPGDVFLGVVHRLDRPVSGVLVFGRTSKGAARLTAAFRERDARKTYWGVAHGRPRAPRGELVQLLVKDAQNNRVRAVAEARGGAREARTTWEELEHAGERTLLELVPRTGRPHQLRVAAQSLGCPLLGDLKYGALQPLTDKSIGLHAYSLDVPHPTRAVRLLFEAPPPALACWSFERCRAARAAGPRAIEVPV